MRVAIYPGSFNPLHEGHLDIIKQVLPTVDKLFIAIGRNPEKTTQFDTRLIDKFKQRQPYYGYELNPGASKIEVHCFDGLLVDYVKKEITKLSYHHSKYEVFLIKGLRNSTDFEYEKAMQYWNEDLGLKIPTYYIISNRNLVHISSSAIRAVNKIKETR